MVRNYGDSYVFGKPSSSLPLSAERADGGGCTHNLVGTSDGFFAEELN